MIVYSKSGMLALLDTLIASAQGSSIVIVAVEVSLISVLDEKSLRWAVRVYSKDPPRLVSVE